RLKAMGYEVQSIHRASDPLRALQSAGAVFVGGGNTFRLLKNLQESGVMPAVRKRVVEGMPYIGSTPGAVVGQPTPQRTKGTPREDNEGHARGGAELVRGAGSGRLPDQPPLPRPRSCLDSHGRNTGRAHPAIPRRERADRRRPSRGLFPSNRAWFHGSQGLER